MYAVKKNWRRPSDRLRRLYAEVMEHAIKLGLWSERKPLPPFYTRKGSGTFGACQSKKLPNGAYESVILLNALLEDASDEQVRKVIVHEVAHALHPGQRHSTAWKRDADRIGKKWGYIAEVRNSDKALNAAIYTLKEKKYRYELYCPLCGKSWKYTRMCNAVRFPERYLCTIDKSALRSRTIP